MKTLKSLFCYVAGLLLAGMVGCATKPNTTTAAVYSDISSTAAPAQPSVASSNPAAAPATETKAAAAKPAAAAAPAIQTAREAIDPQLLRPSSEPFTLGPGDGLELEIVGTPASRTTTTVGLDGKIYFNLLPGLDVWGMTLDQARDAIERELGKLVTAPQVSV